MPEYARPAISTRNAVAVVVLVSCVAADHVERSDQPVPIRDYFRGVPGAAFAVTLLIEHRSVVAAPLRYVG